MNTAVEGWGNIDFGNLIVLIRNGFSGKQVGWITEYPVTRIETISNGMIDPTKVGYVEKIPGSYLLRTGDILFSNINSLKHIGKAAQVKNGTYLFHGMNLLVFRSSDDIDVNFLFFKLIEAKPWFEKMATQAVNQASINQTTIKELQLHIPASKPEQSKIAEVLSKVDQAIEQTESLIAKQQRIKTGLMQDLLTRGIDEHGNLRSEETHDFKDSPLGRIPVEWELFTVDSLGEVVTGSTPSTSVENYYDGDIMFVSPKDISNTSELITQTEKTLSPSGLSVCRAIPVNSICTVCIGSTIGKIGLTKSQCATNQQINTLIPYISEDAEMLLFAMRLFLRPQLRREAGLQAVPIVNKALFSKMILPFSADPDEKTRARTVLSAASSQIDAQIAYSEKLRSLKTALMQDLLTGKKRVTPLIENIEVCS
ncbi:restriction endonuclease subunit S [Geobacter anodireducens]|uniref:Restriction endonuclease subunit S n=1 Tax=Geobacter anodireducens TaxID=1340425 RepID=A0ABR9NSL2_9BACT|nr:restriction endonuclease subunit S [Geobacter anodireducens]MBE2887252.1 restriction endonuclease subunit S [Geobacter anodireducens]